MKHLSYYITLMALLALTSCFNDKDEIAHRDFDHVLAVDSIPGESLLVYIGDTLRLSPRISLSEGSRPEDYAYCWLIGKDTVSRKQELEWVVTKPRGYEKEKTIGGVFMVRNTVNTLEFRQVFSLQIQSNLSPTYIAVYENGNNTLEWASIQGKPDNFTRFIPGMNALTNGADKPIAGSFRGGLICKTELALFTDNAPGFGYCISTTDDAAEENSVPIGNWRATIRESVYQGAATRLDFHSVRYCEGGSRFLIMNNNLYAFNGTNKNAPIFDDNTYLTERGVIQVMASKQFMRYKRATLIRRQDNSIACFHEYSDTPETMQDGKGNTLQLDTLYGMFSESTGKGSKKPYKIYLIGAKDGNASLYEYDVTYSISLKKFTVPTWSKTIPLPASTVAEARAWFGAFSVRYGFYVTAHAIYRFDYLDITDFKPEPVPFKAFPDNYEIIEIYPLIGGSGLKDADGNTVVFLYDKTKNTTTIHVYDTVTGETVREYPDALPGRGKDFIKC